MADRTSIEWTDATWTPIRARRHNHPGGPVTHVGWHCEKVSAGCDNCYAQGINLRLGTKLPFKPGHLAPRGEVEVFLDETMLTAPLRWRRPRKIFVNSMTDTFGPFVTDDMLDRMFATMALCPQHTFQVLTKRPERAMAYLTKLSDEPSEWRCKRLDYASIPVWPLPNVWLGTSVEDQATADARIPHLLATPAAVRFGSAEPLLGPLDLTRVGNMGSVEAAFPDLLRGIRAHMGSSKVSGVQIEAVGKPWQATTYYQTVDHMGGFEVGSRYYPSLDWVIVGGESGPGARPMHPDLVRSVRDQCIAAGVSFFFKQWGEWFPYGEIDASGCQNSVTLGEKNGSWHEWPQGFSVRIGKARAGRLLDGHEWNEVPHG